MDENLWADISNKYLTRIFFGDICCKNIGGNLTIVEHISANNFARANLEPIYPRKIIPERDPKPCSKFGSAKNSKQKIILSATNHLKFVFLVLKRNVT